MVTKFDPKKALAASKSWKQQSELVREKIRISQIVNRLQDHAEGNCDMSATQVKAAQVLLDRVLPTISVQDITTNQADQTTYQDKINALVELVTRQAGDKAEMVLNALGITKH